MISIPVSFGEAFDKYSILEIKKSFLTSNTQLDNITREINYLQKQVSELLETPTGVQYYNQILECNARIWRLMDSLYALHHKFEINEEYAKLCYEVTELNKERAFIKREIDSYFNSEIKEEKSYFETPK